WGSGQIIGLAVLAVAATAAFCMVELRVVEPILPLHVFRNRNFSLTMALTFLTGLAMFGALTFLPLYQQTVQGASPTLSGLMLTPMMLGVTVTSIVAGQVTTRTGRYKIFPILGGAIMGAGMYLLTGLGISTTKTTSAIYYVVLGLGMGFLMQMVSLIAQNSVQQRDMGVASSARMFFQQIGGSLGVAAFGAIFARKLTESLASAAGTGVHISASGGQLDPATVNSLPAQIKHDVFFAISHAVQSVFIWALPAAVLIFVLALFIKEVPLRGRIAPPEAGETASQQPELVS
ncbi:MAG TPA: MFS transporter, partial [Streptosporangiaceae bacterium]|nr:MFS transporter [Streptosporangiaceae bacterium]